MKPEFEALIPEIMNPPFILAAAGLKLRFAENKRGFWIFFRHEVPILARQLPDKAVGSLCTVGFRREIPLGSPTAC